MTILCLNCRLPYPDQGVPYRCEKCGGVFDIKEISYKKSSARSNTLIGHMWDYENSFGFSADTRPVSLGEGGTPLVEVECFNRRVFFKCEGLNPTGSYKDRGSSVLATFLKSRGIKMAVEDSSGNAGASFAAYATRSGIKAKIYLPESASGPKRRQIELYGAEIVAVPGPRSNAAEAVKVEADKGMVYASHAYLPHGIAGYATIAYEVFEQLGESPGAIIMPVGQGNLLLGIGRGFQALQKAGTCDRIPQLIGVQVRACAPLWAVFHYGAAGLGWVTEGDTIAEGVKVRVPLRGDLILQMVEQSLGTFMAVDEQEILPGRDELAKNGLYVEPTSAIVWPALQAIINDLPDPIVVILSGIGLKSLV
jgi:threonine synthase